MLITTLATEVATTTAEVNPIPIVFSSLVGYLIGAFSVYGIFKKAGEPTWQAFVPFWNTIVLLKVVGKPLWWFVLLFIPLVNIVVLVLIWQALSTSFGHGAGFTVGLFFLPVIFLYILSYDSSAYRGADAAAPVGYATA
ncbi:signal peptidase I [Cellulomonas humilata]|uniref:Signal peptidase I n=1 Tax=Cellulomonas humilata TaxID=144055 RepID=A0A7Y6DY41_9CELL|nr:DUF5684 domain-containing protein [Cellulomonas humilata]NUU19191.1 signal peptidase I [Cellulomonas humilata]